MDLRRKSDKIARDYIDAIINQVTYGGYALNNQRSELHDKLADAFGFTKKQTKIITDNLDKYIGFPLEIKYDDIDDINENYYAEKLIRWLRSSEFKMIIKGKIKKKR